MRYLVALVATLVLLAAPGSARTQAPWRLQVELGARVAPNHFDGTVTGQLAGPATRIGERVTLRITRLTRCAIRSGKGSRPIRCGSLGSRVAARPGLPATVMGQFETGHLGAIGFVAATVLLV